MVEMPGGGGLRRTGLMLGCSAKKDDDEEERKKDRQTDRQTERKKERKKERKNNLGKGYRSPVQTLSYLHNQLV